LKAKKPESTVTGRGQEKMWHASCNLVRPVIKTEMRWPDKVGIEMGYF
jgi:hypothetical protein